MICRHCKKPIKDESNFCKYCGSEVKGNNFFIVLKDWLSNHRKAVVIVAICLLVVVFLTAIEDDSQTSISNFDTNSQVGEVTKGKAQDLDDLEEYFENSLKGSVVNIYCSSDGENITLENAVTGGSGTMITSDGIVLTNYHILFEDDYNRFLVNSIRCLVLLSEPEYGSPEEMYIAKPLAIPDLNAKYDLVFLEIIDAFTDEDGEVYGDYPRDFTAYDNDACLGKGNPKLGERIRIFGYPAVSGGWSLTVTDGLVSSFDEDGDIVTSAKIDSGNSGGLAVDERGCIVGVPVAVSIGDYENLGEVISVNNVNHFLLEFKERNDSEQIFTNVKFE